ncbi:hypothetical protein JCM12107_10600 [Corynebacterium simulans]
MRQRPLKSSPLSAVTERGGRKDIFDMTNTFSKSRVVAAVRTDVGDNRARVNVDYSYRDERLGMLCRYAELLSKILGVLWANSKFIAVTTPSRATLENM